jgi:hypothetical protein
MKQRILFALLIAIAWGQPVWAANPDDIDFTLRLTGNVTSYHLGEPIEFEISYASNSAQKYLTSMTSPIPESESVTVRVVPVEGTLDPRSLRTCWGGIGLSILSSGPLYLTPKPITEHADLTKWYRFQKSGHYTLTVTSHMVSRVDTPEEGSSREAITLESNTIEFDILPPDQAWQAIQLQTILTQLDAAQYPGDRAAAIERLDLLDTPDAARALVGLYLSNSDLEKSSFAAALSRSSQLDVVIPPLEAALSNPALNPSGVVDLLAGLKVRKQLGVSPMNSGDPAAQQKSQAECGQRRKLYDQLRSSENEVILSRIQRQAGAQQPAALYEAWWNIENQEAQDGHYASTAEASGTLSQLRQSVLSVAEQLSPDQRTQFVTSQWTVLPHGQLFPVIRELALAHRFEAEKLWCEDWPGDCSAEILSGALQAGTPIGFNDILLVPESQHPEMDAALREQLAGPGILETSVQSQRTAALVLRAGSRAILPAVEDAISHLVAGHRANCEVEAYLAGYLFRFSVEEAKQRLGEMLRDEKCGSEFLRFLNTARYSDDLIPVAVKALDSPDQGAAAMAALFLGEHGPAQVEDALWKRLDAFWLLWHDRGGELRNILVPGGPKSEWQSPLLEQSLASALSNARTWKLSQPEEDRLRAGCITEQCREIADHKMWKGM